MTDLDEDLDTGELLPLDLYGNARRVDDPAAADCAAFGPGNCGTAPIPDMGIAEGRWAPLPDVQGAGDAGCVANLPGFDFPTPCGAPVAAITGQQVQYSVSAQ